MGSPLGKAGTKSPKNPPARPYLPKLRKKIACHQVYPAQPSAFVAVRPQGRTEAGCHTLLGATCCLAPPSTAWSTMPSLSSNCFGPTSIDDPKRKGFLPLSGVFSSRFPWPCRKMGREHGRLCATAAPALEARDLNTTPVPVIAAKE